MDNPLQQVSSSLQQQQQNQQSQQQLQQFIEPQNIVDLPLFFCQKHPKFQLNMICAEPKCEKKGLICCRCLTKDHLANHQIQSILNLEEVLEMCLQKVDCSEKNEDFRNIDHINDDIVERLQFLGQKILQVAQNLQVEVNANRRIIKQEAQNHLGSIKCLLDLLQNQEVDQQRFATLVGQVSEMVVTGLGVLVEAPSSSAIIEGGDNAEVQGVVGQGVGGQSQGNQVAGGQGGTGVEGLAQKRTTKLTIESLNQFLKVNEEVLANKCEILNERVQKIVDLADGIKIFDSMDPTLFKVQIYKDFPIQNLLNYGWKIVYDYDFSHKTTSRELKDIQQNCFDHSLVCVGAIHRQHSEKLCLCAIDTAKEVFQETFSCKIARKSMQGDVYWYYCNKISFGFAPVPEINLNDGDYNTSGNRLCWKLNGDGGYRVGDAIDLYNKHCNYKKVMLVLK